MKDNRTTKRMRPFLVVTPVALAGADVLRIKGDLAWNTVKECGRKITTLDMGGCRPIVLDLSGVDFIDSRGMSFLLKTNRQFRDRRVMLASLPPNIKNVLERTFILKQFIVLDKPEDLESPAHNHIFFA